MNLQSRYDDKPKTVLITGASKRIGEAIAKNLAKAGCNIAIHHLNSDGVAEALCCDLDSAGVKAVAIKADLTNHDEVESLFNYAVNQLGEIDLLINNASIFEPDDCHSTDSAVWESHFDVHVKAPSQLAGYMAKQKNQRQKLIVNMIDQRVWKPTPDFYSYTLSKSALLMATKTLAQSLAPNIRVNAIGPGPSLPNERQNAQDFQKQVDGLILGSATDLDEFADTILWMWRSKSLTGQMIALDGGQHLAWQTPDVSNIIE